MKNLNFLGIPIKELFNRIFTFNNKTKKNKSNHNNLKNNLKKNNERKKLNS
jgi:hypothetical protein